MKFNNQNSTMRSLFFTCMLFCIGGSLSAQVSVLPGGQPVELAELINGDGVQILNPIVNCADSAYGTFGIDNVPGIPESRGLILSTGNVVDIQGPNLSSTTTTEWNTPGDAQITTIAGATSFDACTFEFDVVPVGDTLRFNFTFASEEYQEYVGTPFNDVFAFLISGPDITGDPGLGGFENIALVPGSSTPVGINTVNNGNPDIGFPAVNPGFFVSNPLSFSSLFEYDGYTTNLFAEKVLNACDTFRLKLVIADVGDRKWDSSVLIESIESNSVTLTASTEGEIDEMIRGCNEGTVVFTRNPVNDAPLSVTYFIGGTAVNGVDYPAIGDPDPEVPKTITIPAGEASTSIDILPLVTGSNDGPRDIIFYIGNPLCPGTVQDSLIFVILDELTVDVVPPLIFLCPGDSVTFEVEGVGNTFNWSPNGGLNNPNIKEPTASPVVNTTYIVSSTVSACFAENTVEVRVSNIEIELDVTDIECGGEPEGSITATITGGETPYEFAWTGPDGYTATTASITDLIPGTYELTVTDREGCIQTAAATISQNPPLELLLSSPTFAGGNNISCNAANDGQATVTINGGTPGYTILWNDPNGQITNTAIGLTAGTYTVEVSDANNCVQTGSITLTQPDPITGNLDDREDVLCFGEETGSLTILAAGGTAPYNYLWNSTPPQTGPSANGIPAGIYTVTITDVNGCIGFAEAEITEPEAPLSGTVTVSTPSCPGDGDATATAVISGGTPPYSYFWSNNPDDTGNATDNLSAGSYSLTVIDENNCVISIPFNVNNPIPLSITLVNITDVSCFGENSGSIAISTSGGTGTVTVTWNTVPESTGTLLSGVPAGTYMATATDENGCTASLEATIDGPAAPFEIDASIADPSCFGFNDGSIGLTADGGTAPYTFNWNTLPPSSGEILNNLEEGIYVLEASDANGCTIDTSFTLTAPDPIEISIASITPVLCFGEATGEVSIVVVGGTAPYEITWDDPDAQIGNTATGLLAGSYEVNVQDASGCNASTTIAINEPSAPLGGTILNQENVACFGENDGSALVAGTGGSGAYSYNWDDPAAQTGALATGLAPGTYTVSISDNNGCPTPFLLEVVITGPSEALEIALLPSIFSGGFNVACAEDSTATLDLSITGGTGPYTVLWDLPGLETSSELMLDSLAPGDYAVLVTDANGCTEAESITLTAPDPLSITVSTTPSLCFGAPEGSIDITIAGGVPGYTANWTGPDGFTGSGFSFDNLVGGIYLVTIEDQNECTLLESVTVIQPLDLAITVDSISDINGFNTSCWNSQDGAIFISASGGNEPYSYTWNSPGNPGFSNQQDVAALAAAVYEVVLIDINGCVQNEFIELIGPDPIEIDFELSEFDNGFNISCSGEANGSITANVSGGTPDYTFLLWIGPEVINPPFSNTVSNLGPGEYSVLLRDANNCTFSSTVSIAEPPAFTVSLFAETINGSNISCANESDGAISVAVSGSSGPYTYAWSGPDNFSSTQQNIAGLAAGEYTVVVTDSNDCSESESITLIEPAPLTLTLSPELFPNGGGVSCEGASDGTINSAVMGGTGPYIFSWSGPNNFSSSMASITNLAEGAYCLTVTDANGCNTQACVTLSAVDLIAISTTIVSPLACASDVNGSIAAQVEGGTEPYTVSWSGPGGFSATTLTIEDLGPGTYCIEILDDNGCEAIACVTLEAPPALDLNLTAAEFSGGFNLTCSDSENGSIQATVLGGTSPYSYEWSGPNGFESEAENIDNLSAGIYELTVTDANECVVQQSITLNAPAPLLADASITLPTCNDGTLADVSINVTGGTSPYSFNWSSGDSEADVSLQEGNYSVIVSDVNGCNVTLAVDIVFPDPIVVTLQSPILPGGFNVACAEGETGVINVLVTGGVGDLEYEWSGTNNFGSDEPGLIGMPSGDYCLIVTDELGCTGEACITLTAPDALDIEFAVSPAPCNSATGGMITATGIGGVPTYSFSWTGPNGFSGTGPAIQPLPAGTYCATITDLLGCTYNECAEVTEPLPLEVSLTSPEENGVNISCFGANTGEIFSPVTGGTAPYTYEWTGPNDYAFNAPNPDFLFAGEYCLVVTDANNCETEACITLTEATGVEAIIDAPVGTNGFNVSCADICDGSIFTTLNGGTAPITPQWSGPAGFESDELDLSGLCAGSYELTTIDGNGCEQTTQIVLTAPPAIAITLDSPQFPGGTEISCFGFENGVINTNVVGGIGDYTYVWTGPDEFMSDMQNLEDLSAGSYFVEVTDEDGCTALADITLSEPSESLSGQALAFEFPSGDNISCNGSQDGSISSIAIGGTDPYEFNWLGPNDFSAQTADIDNLGPGLYTLVIEDLNSCVFTINVDIQEPTEELSTSAVLTNEVLCHDAPQGSISASAVGGSPEYSIVWSGPNEFSSEAFDIDALIPGTYAYDVSDMNGCSFEDSLTIDNPLEIVITGTIESAICASSTGAIGTAIAGGSPPYTFVWSNGAETQNIEDVPQGSYTIEVTDSNECLAETTFQIDATNNLELFANLEQPLCAGDSNGAILIEVLSGANPISYNWTGPDGFTAGSSVLLNIAAGTYNLMALDSNGCALDTTIVLGEPDTLMLEPLVGVIYPNGFNLTGFESEDGVINAPIINGGTSPFSFAWSGPNDFVATGPGLQAGLSAGTYSLLVIDDNNCSDSAFITLVQPIPLEIPNGISPNGDGLNDGFIVRGLEDFPRNKLLVFNRWGNLLYEEENYSNAAPWMGVNNDGEQLPQGTYFVILELRDRDSLRGYLELRR